jgi:hypothetical protein
MPKEPRNRTRPEGITVQCVACKRRLLLSFEEASARTDMPTCERCYMPMVAVQASVNNIGRRL